MKIIYTALIVFGLGFLASSEARYLPYTQKKQQGESYCARCCKENRFAKDKYPECYKYCNQCMNRNDIATSESRNFPS